MATRGSKVERGTVSNQPHELKYEAQKNDTSVKEVKAAKQDAGSNKRPAVEQKLKGK